MIVRDDLVIGQPSHAWVTSQIGRAWGNAAHPAAEPFEPMIVAAVQHDVGWVEADLAPQLNPETGRPRGFLQMPRADHLRIWSASPRWLLTQSRYAALIVSRHGTSLYDRVVPEPEQAEAIAAHLAEQRALQAVLSVGLDMEQVARNGALLRTWDAISLALCHGVMPAQAGEFSLSAGGAAGAGDGVAVRLDPWPFGRERVEIACEGRALPGTFTSEAELREAFAAAPAVALRWTLVPA
ncbi:DUF3891 family protein [Conexibacter woesei]|uniref:DUF3891 domain-containing protein n=1 Tax=Conexibacter woesei (strain DSM 14684 / CCUG 47730 / CIP 108061 / JCM 11494 / NBRC 100937 / ID131577) TaxID=469383 RepID=D3F4P5_CONWI|nr:DUF3891 family protein [Conexibacter woesei]ADB52502.1 hypothetical protein Cwoe_4087 [Conexibacter woesei DSM 14684]